MKFINFSLDSVEIIFKSYPVKIVKPGGVVNLSKNKYNDLVDKNLKKLNLDQIKKNRGYQQILQTPKYKELYKKIKIKKEKDKKDSKDKKAK